MSQRKSLTRGAELIAETQRTLSRPDLTRALGKYGTALSRAANQLVAARIRRDQFDLPANQNSDAIPVVFHANNKKLRPGTSFNALPPQRIRHIQNLLAQTAVISVAIEQQWQEHLPNIESIQLKRDQEALFVPLHFELPNPKQPHNPFLVAPYSIINLAPAITSDAIPFFIHELTHHLQCPPVTTRQTYDRSVSRDELEAYHVEALTRKTLGGIYLQGDGIAEEIEELRQKYNRPTGTDMFEITAPLQKAIAKLAPFTRRQIRRMLALSD